MKTLTRHILSGIFLVLFCAGMGVVLHFARERRHTETCSKIEVSISEKYHFVSEGQIKKRIESDYGAFLGRRLDSLGLARIEKIIDNESAVKKSQVWVSSDGVLHVMISQREPVIRFQKGDYGYYADETGSIFPLQKNYTSQVMVVDGNIPVNIAPGYKGKAPLPEERQWVSNMLDMVDFMKRSHNWYDNIVQISVEENGDLVLIPRNGEEKFIFGKPEEFKARFARIERYYSSVKPQEQDYRSINVKYDGQIICRKN